MKTKTILFILSSSLLSACTSLSYYSQSISGHLSVMASRTPISELLDREDLGEKKRQQLLQVLALRDFASKHLHLPRNQSYTTYVELDRDYVVWNVVATPKFSLDPIRSCFVLVGCLEYKGFYDQQDAQHFATQLKKQGNEVFIGGVSAYSTLGWFADPVLSSMLRYGHLRVAEVIFHELAHQKIYLKGDSAFNEAFATIVGQTGVRRWLAYKAQQLNNDRLALQTLEREQQWDEQFVRLILKTKASLQVLYESPLDRDQMGHEKLRYFTQLRRDYEALKARVGLPDSYDQWIHSDLNNAKIASVVTYHDLSRAFANLLDLSQQQLSLFYRRVEFLTSLSEEKRQYCLEKLGLKQLDQECLE